MAIVEGSLALQARNFRSTTLVRDLNFLAKGFDLGKIDERRRVIIQKWQSSANRRESWVVKINAENGSNIVVSRHTDFRVVDESHLVNVERYIRGEVVDLGGARSPNAHIRLPDGKTLVVRTDRDLLRKETENHLYKQVHVRIQAKRDIQTGELSDAHLVEFVQYAPRFDEHVFELLTAKGEEAWKDIEDPAEWVRNLRGTSD